MKNGITLLLLLTSFLLCGQTYKGTVQNKEGQPIEFANVIALNNSNDLLAGIITNEKGEFEISIKPTVSFSIVVSYIGFENWVKKIDSNTTTNLGVIMLKENNQLEEVIVTARKKIIERRADKLIFNIENSAVASGVDGLEAIKYAPRIDPTSESLKVIGKSSAQIFVNGRPLNIEGSSLNTYLKSLRSENIKRVEVITSPSAKYDAEGNKAIINIVLKRNQDAGFDGSFTGTYIQRSLPTIRPSTFLTYSKGKLSTSLNLSFNEEKKNIDQDSDIIFEQLSRESRTDRRQETTSVFGNLDVDYRLTSYSSIGFRFNGEIGQDDETYSSTTSFINLVEQQVDSTFSLPSFGTSNNTFFSISPYYDIEIDSLGSQIKLNYNFLNSDTEDSRELFSSLFESNSTQLIRSSSALNESRRDFSVNAINIDVELVKEKSKWEFGGKTTFINNDSEISFFDTSNGSPILDTNQSNIFLYDETILAAYLNYERSIGDKIFVKAGLRYENTSTEGNSITLSAVNTNSYDNLLPSFFVSYDPNDNHSFSLAYSTNLDRPSFTDVNPFRTFVDLFAFTEGNPFLLPSFTQNLEFSYTLKNNFSLLLYGSFINDAFDYLTLSNDQNNTVISSPQNYFDQDIIGIDISYNWKPTSWFRSFNSLSGSYNNSVSEIPNITLASRDGFGYTFSNRNVFLINKKRQNRLYLNFFQNFPSTDGFVRAANRASLTIGGIFTFYDRNMTLNVYAGDIFRQFQSNITETFQDYNLFSNTYNDARRLGVSVTYKIGNKKSKRKNRDVDDSDKVRIN